MPFNYAIQFVESSTKLSVNLHSPQRETQHKRELNGDEISQFYKNLVSEPSTINYQRKYGRKVNVKVDSQRKKPSGQSVGPCRPLNIFRSAQEGDLDGIRHCLSEGVDVNARDYFGWTPLMCAACSGAIDAVQFLLEKGAERNSTDHQGRTASDLAHLQGRPGVVSLLQPRWWIKEERLSPVHGGSQTSETEDVRRSCSLCKVPYNESRVKHEASIVHQLNCDRVPRPPFYHIPETNIGFRLMVKDGWDKEGGLGPSGSGQKYPVKTALKHDRRGLGHGRKRISRITHFDPFDASAVKDRYRNAPRERTMKKHEREARTKREKQKEIDFRNEFL